MQLRFQKASAADIAYLTEVRLKVLRSANGLPDGAALPEVEAQTRVYYEQALRDGLHIAYLVFDGERFAASGGVSFFRVLPTCHVPTGEKAYIMNLYTEPAYRRKGIAWRVLDLLVREAREKGVSEIMLEATAMGRPLYEKYGFVGMPDEMELSPFRQCE